VSARMIERNSIRLDKECCLHLSRLHKVFIVIALFSSGWRSTQIPHDKSSGSGQARGVMRPWPQGSVTGRPTESHYLSAEIRE
jgi:hypothetical protein